MSDTAERIADLTLNEAQAAFDEAPNTPNYINLYSAAADYHRDGMISTDTLIFILDEAMKKL